MDRDMPQEFIQRAKFELECTQNDPLGMEGRFDVAFVSAQF